MGQSTWGLWNTSNSSLDTNPSSKNSSKTHTKCESVSPSTLARPVSRSVTPVGNCTASSMASSQTARCLPTRPSAAVTTLSTPFSPRLVPASTSHEPYLSISSPPYDEVRTGTYRQLFHPEQL